MDGIGLFTNYPDNVWLGNPKFAPVYEELNRRRAIAYTHPNTAACCTNLTPGIADTVVEYGASTTRAIATMVFGGFDKAYPDIKVIFSHAGGMMPFLIERFEFQASTGNYSKDLPNGVHPALEHFLYDTAQSTNPEALGTRMKVVPTSRILFGTDYPHMCRARGQPEENGSVTRRHDRDRTGQRGPSSAAFGLTAVRLSAGSATSLSVAASAPRHGALRRSGSV